MTGETERYPSGWTTDTVKVLEDEKIAALERYFGSEVRRLEEIISAARDAVTLLAAASQIAQDKFEATVRDGFVKQNEFRGSLDDLGKTMATRRELEALQTEYRDAHQVLVTSIADLRTNVAVGPAQLATLVANQAESSGRQRAAQQFTTNVIGMIIAVAAVAGIAGHYLK